MSRLNVAKLAGRLSFSILFSFTPLAGSATAEPSVFELNCLECHDDTWDDGIAKLFIHKPFLEKNCITCHSAHSSLLVDDKPLLGSPGLSTSHWFEFASLQTATTLVLKASFSPTLKLSREIPLPPLATLSEHANGYGTPPEISEINILEVAKGILISASISWQTDRPTGFMITYGIKDLRQTTPMVRQFKTKHLATLSDLKSDQTYQFRIMAEDTFGNRTESDIFTFSTASTFSNPALKSATGSCCLVPALNLESSFFRKGDRYLVNITSSQLFNVVLGLKINDHITNEESSNPDEAGLEYEEKRHIILTEEEIVTFIICKRCHRDFISHHPVNVYPKKGMKIIADYPTMAGGKISCISCHFPHASDLGFLLRKDQQQELCLGCHKSSAYSLPAGSDHSAGSASEAQVSRE